MAGDTGLEGQLEKRQSRNGFAVFLRKARAKAGWLLPDRNRLKSGQALKPPDFFMQI